MKHEFKIWSKSNPGAIKNICPNLGLREWYDLNSDEKQKIWKHFSNKSWFTISAHIYHVVNALNDKYKRKSFGERILEHGGPHLYEGQYPYHNQKFFNNCCLEEALKDFLNIFLYQNQDVVYELLSIYAMFCIDFTTLDNIDKAKNKQEQDNIKNNAFKKIDDFKDDFNDLFEQFNLNVVLTRQGIVFRQDSKITDEIYQPVLTYLSGKKWNSVNRDLSDAFTEFQKKTPQGYSACITHSVSSVQAFLQILVSGETGKGEINQLIAKARSENKIPTDLFTEKIFKDIESILMAERQKTGNPHPKKEYANEKNAKLLLNLVMIFMQHCILDD